MDTIEKLTSTLSTSWGAALIAGVWAYFAPMAEVFIVLMAFVSIDLVSGVLASRKQNIPCNSRRLRQSVVKMASYITVMLLVFAAERAFSIEWLTSYKILGGFICFVELISILENLAILTEMPIFLRIIKMIRGEAKKKHGEVVDEMIAEKNTEPIKHSKKHDVKTDLNSNIHDKKVGLNNKNTPKDHQDENNI